MRIRLCVVLCHCAVRVCPLCVCSLFVCCVCVCVCGGGVVMMCADMHHVPKCVCVHLCVLSLFVWENSLDHKCLQHMLLVNVHCYNMCCYLMFIVLPMSFSYWIHECSMQSFVTLTAKDFPSALGTNLPSTL